MELGGTFDQQLKLDKDKEEVEKLIASTKKEDAKSAENKDDKTNEMFPGLAGFPGMAGMPANLFGMGGLDPQQFSKEEMEQSTKMFQDMMKEFQGAGSGGPGAEGMSENPFLQGYSQMFQDMQSMNGENAFGSPEVLQKMYEGLADNFSNPAGGGDFMENMLSSFSGFMEENKDNPEFKQVFESLMKDFVSKDNLYPPMKEMQKELPKWLEENQSKISPEDLERYNKQLDQVDVVCKLFEENKEDDPKHAESIVEAINKLQEFGSPPEELIKRLTEQQFPDPQ